MPSSSVVMLRTRRLARRLTAGLRPEACCSQSRAKTSRVVPLDVLPLARLVPSRPVPSCVVPLESLTHLNAAVAVRLQACCPLHVSRVGPRQGNIWDSHLSLQRDIFQPSEPIS